MTAILIAIWKDPTLKMESKGPDHLTPESPKWSQLRSWALNLLRYKFPSLLQPVLIVSIACNHNNPEHYNL